MTHAHGSQTVILPSTQLILLDCFETLVQLDGTAYRARLGVEAFLDHYAVMRRVPCVVISDATETAVETALDQAKLRARFGALYHAGNALQTFPDGRSLKRLDRPLHDLGIAAKDAVFIGDSKFDEVAARHFKVPFIRIPRSEDHRFSLATLITGASQYNSGEFEIRMLNRYRPKRH
jgi:phosphoglycolate phosphatase-like HAD superfamily hydrolase